MKNILLVIAVVALAAAAYWFGTRQGGQAGVLTADGGVTVQRSDMAQAPQRASNQTANSPTNRDVPSASSPAATVAQTAVAPAQALVDDTPLTQRFDALAQAAEQGDVQASCKLAKSLATCRQLNMQRLMIRASMDNMVELQQSDDVSDEQISSMAKRQARLEKLERLCQGVSREQTGQAYRFQSLAARQGALDLQREYLTNPALSMGNFMNELDKWQDYKQHAPQIAMQLLQQGQPQAVTWLAQMHTASPEMYGGVGFTDPDPERAAMYWLLSRGLMEHPEDPDQTHSENRHLNHMLQVSEGLTEAQIAQAQQRADALRQQYFPDWEQLPEEERIKRMGYGDGGGLFDSKTLDLGCE